MSLTIPLTPPATSLESRPTTGLALPIGIGAAGLVTGTGGTEQTRQLQVLRAVAAAAAVRNPTRALELVKSAKDDPSSVIGATVDQAALAPVLLAVTQKLTDRTGAPEPTDAQKAAARAIGADPVLVAVANQAIASDTALNASLAWAAVVDASLLDRAARAGASELQLDLVPDAQQSARLDQVDTRVTELTTRVAKLETDAAALVTRLAGIDTRFGGIDTRLGGVDTRLDGVDTRLTAIADRVTALEGVPPPSPVTPVP